jgi:hypothetical protein
MSTLQEIEAAVLRLSDKDRLQLADKLLGSLPPPPAAGNPEDILNEAIRRDAEIETGAVRPLSEAEFRISIAAVKAGPTRFPFYQKSDRHRRVRLKSFPFLVVYRESAAGVRVILLKHERRHPRFGMARR